VNRRLDEILVSFASILVLIALKHFFTPKLLTVSIIMAVSGAILLLFGEKLLDGEPSQVKSFFINLVGVLLVVGGFQFIAEHFSVDYWWAMGLVGVGLYASHHYISERL
jgi:hypothetical protein